MDCIIRIIDETYAEFNELPLLNVMHFELKFGETKTQQW